jgi:hypothetical protein
MAKSRGRDEEDPKRPKPVARDGAYVMMLFVCLAALITGCVLLYLDWDEYARTSPPKEKAPDVQALGAPAKLEPLAPAAPPAAPGAPPAGPGDMGGMPPMPAAPPAMP